MEDIIDYTEYRRKERETAQKLEAKVTEHFVALCELMEQAPNAFVVKTPFGKILFDKSRV